MDEFERITEITPAYDRRDVDPERNYGIHGCELRMVLKGPKGAVQFVVYTNWQLPHVTEEFRRDLTPKNHFFFEPMPADVGYHSPVPMYEGQRALGEIKWNFKDKEIIGTEDNAIAIPIPREEETGTFTHCPYLNGKCYYDGSGLQALEVHNILLQEGSEGVWKELEKRYNNQFNGE